jgi:hypothetical protein
MSPIRQELLAVINAASDEALEPILHLLKAPIQQEQSLRPRSGRSLLRHAGKWQGEDFEECLQVVYDSRSEAKF